MNHSARILLVDDDAAFTRVATTLLSPYGEVVVALTAEAAIAALPNCNPLRAAIIDLCLPCNRSGLDLVDEVRLSHPQARIMLISGNLDLRPANDAYLAGVAYVDKPLTCQLIKCFMESAAVPLSTRIDWVLTDWRERYKITPGQQDVLRRLALGEDREEIAMARNCAVTTIKRHIFDCCQRTTDESALSLVQRILSEAAARAIPTSPPLCAAHSPRFDPPSDSSGER